MTFDNGVFNDADDAKEALNEAEASTLSPVVFFKPGKYTIKLMPDKDATGIKSCYAPYQSYFDGKPAGIKHLFPGIILESDNGKIAANPKVVRYLNLTPGGLTSLLSVYAKYKNKWPLLNQKSYTVQLDVVKTGSTTYTFSIDAVREEFDASGAIYPELNVFEQAKAEENRNSKPAETEVAADDDDLPF